MDIETDFNDTLNKFSNMETPEHHRKINEILENNKLLDKWDLKTVYRTLNEVQKYNAVRYFFRVMTKANKNVKEILELLSKEDK